jgi:predicted secreted protein
MTFSSGLLVYVMVWVVILFLILPWGVRLPEEAEQGHALLGLCGWWLF